jgi:hypothetical protein
LPLQRDLPFSIQVTAEAAPRSHPVLHVTKDVAAATVRFHW